MEIKSADEILEDVANINKDGDGNRIYYQWEVLKAMKEYAEQFIDLASEEAVSHYLHEETEIQVKESILELKQLIK